MKRRDALKNIGLSIGYTIATPSILSLLQSCKNEAAVWTPQFFSFDEGIALKNIVDLILPVTEDSPGALDVNVPEFIDIYTLKALNKKTQTKIKKGFASVINALNIPEEGISELKLEDYDVLLAKYLKANEATRKAFKNNKEDSLCFFVLNFVRYRTIWAYKTSELIGETVLAYDPIPGPAKGCISVEEATDGKAWSL